MSIRFIEEDRKVRVLGRTIAKRWLSEVIRREGKRCGDITYVFCSDKFLLDINMRFLHRDYFTDVISFDYSYADLISGDIMISVDRVKENAETLDVSYLDELRRIMVHGLLHLIGYDDTTAESKAVMSALEDLYLGVAQEEGKY